MNIQFLRPSTAGRIALSQGIGGDGQSLRLVFAASEHLVKEDKEAIHNQGLCQARTAARNAGSTFCSRNLFST
jgi:hypothetical protein